jgi:DNA-binding LacI/PurR family transcriptional regulator
MLGMSSRVASSSSIPTPRRITSADVARVSGVSRTTVSYVLNDTPGASISAETRAHVLATATRLGYTPSAAARSLRSGRSDLVLVLQPRWVTSAVTDAFLGTLGELLDRGGLTMLVHYGSAKGQLSQVWRAVTPRAVISATPFTVAEQRELSQAGVQALESVADGSGLSLQERIGQLQVEHLAAAGHTRIAYASIADPNLVEFAAPRLAGVRRTCASRGLREPVVAELALQVDAVRPVIDQWRRLQPPVTAVAAYNDEVAMAVLGAAQLEGVGVPDELAVIGVDDLPAGRLVVPALTTVAQPAQARAHDLAAIILGSTLEADGRSVELPRSLEVVARGSA